MGTKLRLVFRNQSFRLLAICIHLFRLLSFLFPPTLLCLSLHYLSHSFPLLLGAVSLVSTCKECPGVEEVKLDWGAFFRKNLEHGPSIVFKDLS